MVSHLLHVRQTMTLRNFALLSSCLLLAAGLGCDGTIDSNLAAADAPDEAAHGEQAMAAQVGAPVEPTAAAQASADDPRGKCGIHSGFPGDEACLLPPPPDEGMQIHVGPSNYDDPKEVAKYVLHPGEESSNCVTVKTPNDKRIVYQTAVISGRSGTHHIINTLYDGSLPASNGFTVCGGGGSSARRIGGMPSASKPYMPRGKVAPEYAHVGSPVPANSTMQAEMHYYNFTKQDILREFWLNVYYAKPEQITTTAKGIAGLGGLGWNFSPIPPGTDRIYKYSCPILGNGYILNLLGHYHAHGKRFTASIKRKSTGAVEKIFEMYDYLSPATFQYNSVVQNPGFSDNVAGAVSGRLAVNDGDLLQWECHIVNDSKVGLRYINAVQTGEMCNLFGAVLGPESIGCTQP